MTESLPSMSGNESFKRSVDDATRYLELLASAEKLADRTAMAIAASEVRVALIHATRAAQAASAAERPAMQATLHALTARSIPLLERAPEEVHEEGERESKAGEEKEPESGEDRKLEHVSQALHIAHYVHEKAETAVELVEEYSEAKAVLKSDAQLDQLLKHAIQRLMRMRKQLAQRSTPKIVEEVKAAERRVAEMASEYEELHAEVPAANKLLSELKENRLVSSLLGASKTLSAGRAGRVALKLGKIAMKVGNALNALAIATDTVKQYVASPSSGAFKVADAVLGGAGTALTTAALPGVDVAIELVAPGWEPSAMIHGTPHALVAIAEATLEKDERPLDRFHERSMKGEYGRPLQLASKTGEAIAQFLAERHFFQGD